MKALTRLDILDVMMRRLLRLADDGDAQATQKLHGMLSTQLRAGELSESMRTLLADMHQSIAMGQPADVATLSKPPAGAPSKKLRDDELCKLISMTLRAWEDLDADRERLHRLYGFTQARPTREAIFKDAAKEFGVSVKTARNIYGKRTK
jgi:hypothetical protein